MHLLDLSVFFTGRGTAGISWRLDNQIIGNLTEHFDMGSVS